MKYELERNALTGLLLSDGRLVYRSTAKTVWCIDAATGNETRLQIQSLTRYLRLSDCDAVATINNASIISNALFWLATRKQYGSSDFGWFRGTAAPRLIFGDRGVLYLYEAGYRDALYPRYRWGAWSGQTMVEALFAALISEIESEDLVASIDKRKAVTLEWEVV